jgi:hypothetical protein
MRSELLLLCLQFCFISVLSAGASPFNEDGLFFAGLSQVYLRDNSTERLRDEAGALLERQLTCDPGFGLCRKFCGRYS